MQHCSFFPGLPEPPDRCSCCKPCCGYILEEMHSHRQECCCFHGIVEVCGLPQHLRPPLTLCGVHVACIAPQCAQNCSAFRLTLRCEVVDCCGCRACGEGSIIISLTHAPVCCGENLRLGARLDVQDARFCAPSGFEICAEIQLVAVTSGPARIFGQPPCAPTCVFPPLYPAPVRMPRERRRRISG